MKFISWNVNGLRAVAKKGFEDIFKDFDADFVCIQETKLQEGQIDMSFSGYQSYWDFAEKKGYSGTAIFARKEPLSVRLGIDKEKHNTEGRTVTLEYGNFYLVCVYTPNAQNELKRIDYRMDWEDAFREYVSELDKEKPVIICGDMNVAHQEIDLKNAKANIGHAGFSDQEREKFSQLLEAGFVDSYREIYPDKRDAYTWWSYRGNARANNVGWRIDYFLTSKSLKGNITDAFIYSDIEGSDHCPIGLDIIL